MKALITGCAGFIGSSLTDKLLHDGNDVIGIDRFSDYYPLNIKKANLEKAIKHPRFTLIEDDIVEIENFPQVDYIFHCAAQAGVRASWGKNFEIYTRDNIQATQHLLESYKKQTLKKFVYSSSSSVYGDAPLPMDESYLPSPVSPYGVTKLAGEHLCYLYWKNYGVPTVSLRYFTVYGPRQRPDMGINKFVQAVMHDQEIIIYGDGTQTRDFTYIDDVVQANLLASTSACQGVAVNIGGGNQISVNDLIWEIEVITGKKAYVTYQDQQMGDVLNTLSNPEKSKKLLHWQAQIDIHEGLRCYVNWINDRS